MKTHTGLFLGLIIGIPAAITLVAVLLLTLLGGAVKDEFSASQTAQIEQITKDSVNQQQGAKGLALASAISLVPQPNTPNQYVGYVELSTGERLPITVIYDPQTQKLVYQTSP